MTTEEKLNELIELIKFLIQVDDGIDPQSANILLQNLDQMKED